MSATVHACVSITHRMHFCVNCFQPGCTWTCISSRAADERVFAGLSVSISLVKQSATRHGGGGAERRARRNEGRPRSLQLFIGVCTSYANRRHPTFQLRAAVLRGGGGGRSEVVGFYAPRTPVHELAPGAASCNSADQIVTLFVSNAGNAH